MISDTLAVVFQMLGAIAVAATLGFGFVFLIGVGDANGRNKQFISRGFDAAAACVLYLSWFGPLLWFGFSKPLFIVAFGTTTALCLIYAASYRAGRARVPD